MTGTGDRTALAGIMRLVEQAQTSRSRAQAAGRSRGVLAHGRGARGWRRYSCWPGSPSARPGFAVERLVTVLVIACPHALGLAGRSSSRSRRHSARGTASSSATAEDSRMHACSLTVVFDKTGTLTLGEHRVVAGLHRPEFKRRRVATRRRRWRRRRLPLDDGSRLGVQT